MKKMIEIDFVVQDSLAALKLYQELFEIDIVEATSFEKGNNEAIFTLYETRFHMLDEAPDYGLFAPTTEKPNTMWFNVTVPAIQPVHDNALTHGCKEIQPVTDMMDMGVSNSMFVDPFGYVWMLHQVHRELSFEERTAHLEK